VKDVGQHDRTLQTTFSRSLCGTRIRSGAPLCLPMVFPQGKYSSLDVPKPLPPPTFLILGTARPSPKRGRSLVVRAGTDFPAQRETSLYIATPQVVNLSEDEIGAEPLRMQ